MYILVNKIKNNSIQSESETELYFEFIKSSLVLPVPLLFKLERCSTDSALFLHVNLWYSHKQFYLNIRTTRIYNQMAKGPVRTWRRAKVQTNSCILEQSKSFNMSRCKLEHQVLQDFSFFQIFDQNRIWFQGQPRKFIVNWSPAGFDQYQCIVSHCAKVVLDSVK